MSKSYGNHLDIFLPEKQLRKRVMTIVTDSKGLDDPKDPDTCNIFALYRLLATQDQQEEMRKNYAGTGYGYGHAKQALFELIMDEFAEERAAFDRIMEDPAEIESALLKGADKARPVAQEVLGKFKAELGF